MHPDMCLGAYDRYTSIGLIAERCARGHRRVHRVLYNLKSIRVATGKVFRAFHGDPAATGDTVTKIPIHPVFASVNRAKPP